MLSGKTVKMNESLYVETYHFQFCEKTADFIGEKSAAELS